MAKKLVSGHLEQKHEMYYMILYLPDPKTGKKRPNWFSTGLKVKGNQTRANKMLLKARKDASNGVLPPKQEKSVNIPLQPSVRLELSSDMLFSDYIKMWVVATRPSWEEVTYDAYYRAVTNIIAPYFEQRAIKLNELTTMDIQEYYNILKQERHIGGNTILHYHANIRKSLVDAIRVYKLITVNPAAEIVRPKIDNFVSGFYDASQLTEMFTAFQGSPIELPVILATYYGLRRSEVLGLKWSSIDFKNRTITISHTISRVLVDNERRMIAKNRTKNKASFRSLPLIPQVESVLIEAQKRQKRNRTLCGHQYNTEYSEYICVNEMGRIIYPAAITTGFKEQLKKKGLPIIRFHDLRHSCASLLLANGISLKEIQLWLGHSNFATTANIYAHLDQSSKKITAATMAQCLPMLVN